MKFLFKKVKGGQGIMVLPVRDSDCRIWEHCAWSASRRPLDPFQAVLYHDWLDEVLPMLQHHGYSSFEEEKSPSAIDAESKR